MTGEEYAKIVSATVEKQYRANAQVVGERLKACLRDNADENGQIDVSAALGSVFKESILTASELSVDMCITVLQRLGVVPRLSELSEQEFPEELQ